MVLGLGHNQGGGQGSHNHIGGGFAEFGQCQLNLVGGGGLAGAGSAAPSEDEHDGAEDQQHASPPKIDVDVERAVVIFWIAAQAKNHEQHAVETEEQSNGESKIEFHG